MSSSQSSAQVEKSKKLCLIFKTQHSSTRTLQSPLQHYCSAIQEDTHALRGLTSDDAPSLSLA